MRGPFRPSPPRQPLRPASFGIAAALRWLAFALCLVGAAARAGEFDRGLLWRIDRPGVAAAPNHVFGTLHVDDPRATRVGPAARAALADARRFAPELLADPGSAQAFAAATRLPAGRTLASLTGAASFERIAGLLMSRYGVPRSDAARLKPWAAYLFLSQPVAATGETVDVVLVRLATRQGLPIQPLETVAQQVAALEAVPVASQCALLDALARDHDAAQAAIGALAAAYLAADLAAIRSLEEAPARDDPALKAPLADWFAEVLDRRTGHMLDALLPQFDTGGTFAAVGALHLQGEHGLLARLAKRGWRVQRVE